MDSDALFDYVCAFLRSPMWTTPLDDFIDHHCLIFDSEEESSHEQAAKHREFCQLVDSLLEESLQEIGVTNEQFVAAVDKARDMDAEINQLIFGSLLSVEDFNVFKKMMVKRNRQLEVEAIRALQKSSQQKAQAPTPQPAAAATATPATKLEIPADADEELVMALKLSMQSAQEAERLRSMVVSDEDAQFRAALALSLESADLLLKQRQMEEAMLEEAIALSLALEAQRLQQDEVTIADNASAAASSSPAVAPVATPAEVKPVPPIPVRPSTLPAIRDRQRELGLFRTTKEIRL